MIDSKIIRGFLSLLLILVFLTSFLTGLAGEEIGGVEVGEELHQAAGYLLFLLVGLHIIMYRKMLINEVSAVMGWSKGDK